MAMMNEMEYRTIGKALAGGYRAAVYCRLSKDDDNYQSPLDILFERFEMRELDRIACKQYRIFKQAAGDICSK